MERHIREMPSEDARTVLLDILVSLPPAGINVIPVEAATRAALSEIGHAALNVAPHGTRAESTYQFLRHTGGATVEQVARAIYGADDAESRKKASSMLSLLKGPQGGSRVVKDEQTEVWRAVDRNLVNR
jgi:hypothetical protein